VPLKARAVQLAVCATLWCGVRVYVSVTECSIVSVKRRERMTTIDNGSAPGHTYVHLSCMSALLSAAQC
jgi:hypothetical protein